MSRGDLLALDAMKKGLRELEAKAAKAKKATEECAEAPTKILAIQREMLEVIQDKRNVGRILSNKLEALERRIDEARKAMKRDYVKLLDSQFSLEWDVEALAERIREEELRLRHYRVLKD